MQEDAYNPGGSGYKGQFNADVGLDWMGIHVPESNNRPSKLLRLIQLYNLSVYLLSLTKIMLCAG